MKINGVSPILWKIAIKYITDQIIWIYINFSTEGKHDFVFEYDAFQVGKLFTYVKLYQGVLVSTYFFPSLSEVCQINHRDD